MNTETWTKNFQRIAAAYPTGNLGEDIGVSWFKELSREEDNVVIGAVSLMIDTVKIPSLPRLKECVNSVKLKLSNSNNHIVHIQTYARTLGITTGEALIIICKKFGWTWKSIPSSSCDTVKKYLYFIHESNGLYDITAPELAERLRDYENGELEIPDYIWSFVKRFMGDEEPVPGDW